MSVETCVIVNNVVAENEALIDGGGILAGTSYGSLTLTNNTITNNTAGDDGGGIDIGASTDTAILYVYNNIIWNNSAVNSGADIRLSGEGIKNGFNNDYSVLFGVWNASAENIDADPVFENAPAGDYHLTQFSPCIDTGDNGAPSLPFTDKDGLSRVVDGNDNGIDVVDMGAYEFIPSSLNRGDLIAEIKVNGSDGPITIAEGETLSVTVELDVGSLEGQDADRWLIAWTPLGWISYRYFDPSWHWVLGLSKLWEGPLFSAESAEVLNTNSFGKGEYFFFYGIDLGPDSSMDYYDAVTVTVGDAVGAQGAQSIPPSVLKQFLSR